MDQPFVGGMLADDHHPVADLGDDISLVHLRAAPSGKPSGIGMAILRGLKMRLQAHGASFKHPTVEAFRWLRIDHDTKP